MGAVAGAFDRHGVALPVSPLGGNLTMTLSPKKVYVENSSKLFDIVSKSNYVCTIRTV